MEKTIKQLANEERRVYLKKWRSENKDKVKKYNANHWENVALKKLNDQSKGVK